MKKFLVFVLVLLAAAVAVGLLSSPEYDIESSVVIDASPQAVHAYVGELTRWPEWAPWHEADPSIKVSYGATTTGVGASQSWTSDDGNGDLTFTRCDPATGIAYDMAFIMEGGRIPSQNAMTYSAVDGGTRVTWSMAGTWKGAIPPVLDGWMKLLSPWMIGGMFDQGLAKLKTVVEAKA